MSDVSARAAAAQRLMDDPILIEALDTVRSTAIDIWQRTKTDDHQGREIAWITVKVIDRIQGELESIITDGKMAAARVQAPLR